MMNERKNAKQLILRGNDRCAICFFREERGAI